MYFILLKFGLPAILLCFSADATLLFVISMSVLQPVGECEKPLKQDNHTKLNPGHNKTAVQQPGTGGGTHQASRFQVQVKCGSRINSDQLPTSRELWEHPFGCERPKVPFPGFLCHSDRIFTDSANHFPDFNLESLKFFTKNIFVIKNLTNFHKTVETGMDPCLKLTVRHVAFSKIKYM